MNYILLHYFFLFFAYKDTNSSFFYSSLLLCFFSISFCLIVYKHCGPSSELQKGEVLEKISLVFVLQTWGFTTCTVKRSNSNIFVFMKAYRGGWDMSPPSSFEMTVWFFLQFLIFWLKYRTIFPGFFRPFWQIL